MFATLLLVRLIRKSRQAEEAFRFNKSEFNTISCFKGSLRLVEIEGAFQYKKVDFLQVGAENDSCARLICKQQVIMRVWWSNIPNGVVNELRIV